MNKLGDVAKKPDGYQVIFERIYNHNIKTVWDALINPAKMSKWFTDVEMDFRPGGKITFIFQDEARSKSFGKIVSIVPEKLFEYIWENEEEEGQDELARWELFEEEPDVTRLVMTYSKLTDDLAISVSTGWHVVIDDLEAFLNGKTKFRDFGGSEPTESDKIIKQKYTELFSKIFNK
ncbi:hypothetical protein D3C87_340530 [compost metagenome]